MHTCPHAHMYTCTHARRIRTDHNEDNTSAILQEWSQNVQELYANVDFKNFDEWLYPTFNPFDTPDERFLQITKLRQAGLDAARRAGADYLFVSYSIVTSLIFA